MLFGPLSLGKFGLYEFDDVTIDHLFAGIRKIHRDIAADNRLYLTNAPIGTVGMRHKVAK